MTSLITLVNITYLFYNDVLWAAWDADTGDLIVNRLAKMFWAMNGDKR